MVNSSMHATHAYCSVVLHASPLIAAAELHMCQMFCLLACALFGLVL